MSGGSMNYLYRKLLWECDFDETTPLREAFSRHLIKVAAALKAVEWVDSGDWSPGDEDQAIAEVLGSGWKSLTDEQLLYIYNELPNWGMDMDSLSPKLKQFARAIEAALRSKNHE
jgi:hypothetical protein